MDIFRIENKDKYSNSHNDIAIHFGAYHESKIVEESGKILSRFKEMIQEHSGLDHPCFKEDFEIYSESNTENYYFACPTLDLIYCWFNGHVEFLLESGYNLIKYTVNDSILGKSGKQCIFEFDSITNKEILN